MEFLFADRFSQFRSKNYPFLLGQARALGLEASWLCCWAPPGRDSRCRYIMDHQGEAADLLLDALEHLRPTHLVLSEKLGDELSQRLSERLPEATVEDLSAAPEGRIALWPTEWLPRWLGLEPPDDQPPLLLDVARPAYSSSCVPPPSDRPLPPAPPVHIVVGPECLYHRSLRRNRFFCDLELPEGAREFACSFCPGSFDLRYPFQTPPVELALRQCLAAIATPDRCTSNHDWVIDGGHLTARLDQFLDALLDHEPPPGRFYLSLRADELLRLGQRLEPLLPRLGQAGHSLTIYNMGVENFSPIENERLNKGLDLHTIDAATELARRWEQQFPETFRFASRGGWGLILFTPWTTLDDLEINLEAMRRPDIDAEGFSLTSKLQILPQAAIAALAANDGLLVDSFDDFHYYDSGCFNRWDQRELPWRFHDPVVAHLYALGCRIVPITDFGDDPLHAEVQALRRDRPDACSDPYELFGALIVAARGHPPPSDPSELLRRAARSLPSPPVEGPGKELADQPPPHPESAELTQELSRLLSPLGHGRRALSLAGHRLVTIHPTHRWPYCVLVLDGEHGEVEVLVHRRHPDQGCFVTAGPRLALGYARRTPLNTEAKRRAVRALAALIERLDARERRP